MPKSVLCFELDKGQSFNPDTSFTCFMVTFCGQLSWSTSCVEPRFYAAPFKFDFIQLLIFIEKFLPLLGFKPRTSPLPVPSRYATNWAILAWIIFQLKLPLGLICQLLRIAINWKLNPQSTSSSISFFWGGVKQGPCTCRAKRYVGTLADIELYGTCTYLWYFLWT